MIRSIANWDGVRGFLAVQRAGGLRRGAQVLGISHATLRRRLAAIEADLGLRLFDRWPDGLHLSPEATELVESMEKAAAKLARRASGAFLSLDGWIHVSAPDLLVSELLAPTLAAFSQQWPTIELRIQTTYSLADLGAREADIALRILTIGQQPEGELVGFKVAPLCGDLRHGRALDRLGQQRRNSGQNSIFEPSRRRSVQQRVSPACVVRAGAGPRHVAVFYGPTRRRATLAAPAQGQRVGARTPRSARQPAHRACFATPWCALLGNTQVQTRPARRSSPTGRLVPSSIPPRTKDDHHTVSPPAAPRAARIATPRRPRM